MKRLCAICNKRPVRDGQELCHRCEQESNQSEPLEIDEARQFKLGIREIAQDLPTLRIRRGYGVAHR